MVQWKGQMKEPLEESSRSPTVAAVLVALLKRHIHPGHVCMNLGIAAEQRREILTKGTLDVIANAFRSLSW